ncbi:hypothetical protein CAEBREN_25080 [Caenorhabditis brenneri]|uniref:F-box domain-containing protein n=1 Tax=Caenorhabditis brenneri TaxID=135651 RepID=G0MGT5_CAEBE|nr:hypothetical protein CAEBREN_25080 [Caenorhabditis brenneri]
MADIFRRNQDAFRGAILFQIKLKVSVEDAFESAKLVLEDDELDFVEFEYLYYKLYEDPLANFSADFTNKAPYCKLENFPPEVLEKIVHDLDPMDQLRVRKVAKCFRIATLKAPCKYNKLKIQHEDDCVSINFNGNRVYYEVYEPQGCMISHGNEYKVFPNENYFDMFLMDLNVILSNPNFCTDLFSIELHNEALGNEETLLKTMENTITDCKLKFNARELKVLVKHGQYLSRIVNMFNTTALEKEVRIRFNSRSETILNLDILSQFEQVKSIRIYSDSLYEFKSSEILAKCQKFYIKCRFREGDIPNIVNLILDSDKFERGSLFVTHLDVQFFETLFPESILDGNSCLLKFKNNPFWLRFWPATWRDSPVIRFCRCTEDDLP